MIEAYEDQKTGVRFYITHSDKEFTTGVTVMPPHTELSAHRRSGAVENLGQVAGRCIVKLVGDDGGIEEHGLVPGGSLSIPEGQLHIHANPNGELSVTLFKAVGDTTAAVEGLRQNLTRIM